MFSSTFLFIVNTLTSKNQWTPKPQASYDFNPSNWTSPLNYMKRLLHAAFPRGISQGRFLDLTQVAEGTHVKSLRVSSQL